MDKETIKRLLADGVISNEVAAKYFPELKESIDERIKKVIKQVLSESTTEKDECYLDNGVTQQEVFAWLEKQGEQKQELLTKEKALKNSPFVEQKPADKVEPKFKVGDIVKHKDNPYLTYILKRFTDDGDYEFHAIGKDGHEGCTCFAGVKYQDEWELVEQKSSEEYNITGIGSKHATGKLKEMLDKKENPAWIEEEDVMLNKLLAVVSLYYDRSGNNLDKQSCISFLKSLKDRMPPQQDWSEEDKGILI